MMRVFLHPFEPIPNVVDDNLVYFSMFAYFQNLYTLFAIKTNYFDKVIQPPTCHTVLGSKKQDADSHFVYGSGSNYAVKSGWFVDSNVFQYSEEEVAHNLRFWARTMISGRIFSFSNKMLDF